MSWPEVPLESLCRPKQWPTISQKQLTMSGYPVYGANGQIGWYSSYNHEHKTVLITCRGATCGTINVSPPKSYVTGNAMALDALDEARIHLEYLVHALTPDRLRKAITGSAQPQITRESLRSVSVPLPPLNEQRRIAAILDHADTLRKAKLRVAAQVNNLIQSLFADRFGHPDEVLSRWPTVKLADVLDFLTSGSRGWAKFYAASGDIFLRIQNVKRDALDLDDLAHVKAPITAEAKRTLVQPGDVLLSITADLGRSAVIPESLGPAYINQHLAILRCSSVNPRYLSAYLTSPLGQRELLGRNRQGVKAGLNFDDIRSLNLPMPPRDIQESFASECHHVDGLRGKSQAGLEALEKLFTSLQSRAFAGQL